MKKRNYEFPCKGSPFTPSYLSRIHACDDGRRGILKHNNMNMKKETDINKVFGKMPEARELLQNKPKEKVNFGLVQQGHIETIERMLDENGYSESSWVKIGKQIKWEPNTAMRYYIKYLRNIRLKEQNDSKGPEGFTDEQIRTLIKKLKEE